jgi:hypothetical protein
VIDFNNSLHVIAAITMIGCSSIGENKEKPNTLAFKNNTNVMRSEVIRIDASRLPKDVISGKIGIGKIGNIPVEGFDKNGAGQIDVISIHMTLGANELVNLDFTNWEPNSNYEKRTQAEISTAIGGNWEGGEYLEATGFENVDYLKVPSAHTDHSWFIRYEGPGWENEMIGYRFYLDGRNAVDIFGKKVDTLVLQSIGQDGFNSYHEESAWGMDILKAGKSLGIGSIGRVNSKNDVEHFNKTDSVTCEIKLDGYLSSNIETNYYGWETSAGKSDLKSVLTINTGDRATIHNVSFNEEVDNFCTGIVKHPNAEFFQAYSGKWGYIATFGLQTLFDDNLGMAIIYSLDQISKVDTTDAYNHLIVFKPTRDLEYQFLGAWEKEPSGIKTKGEFEEYLNRKLVFLNSPIEIK